MSSKSETSAIPAKREELEIRAFIQYAERLVEDTDDEIDEMQARIEELQAQKDALHTKRSERADELGRLRGTLNSYLVAS